MRQVRLPPRGDRANFHLLRLSGIKKRSAKPQAGNAMDPDLQTRTNPIALMTERPDVAADNHRDRNASLMKVLVEAAPLARSPRREPW
jgi:hypothetical protein